MQVLYAMYYLRQHYVIATNKGKGKVDVDLYSALSWSHF